MKYYIDAEFNGFGGQLLSFAIVREDNEFRHFVFGIRDSEVEPWVRDNVMPHRFAAPLTHPNGSTTYAAGRDLAAFIRPDDDAHIHFDWPEDAIHFLSLITIGGGNMFATGNFALHFEKVDMDKLTLPGAIRHNPYWDSMLLKHYHETKKSQ